MTEGRALGQQGEREREGEPWRKKERERGATLGRSPGERKSMRSRSTIFVMMMMMMMMMMIIIIIIINIMGRAA